jgi:excisionase family DNA binding protein
LFSFISNQIILLLFGGFPMSEALLSVEQAAQRLGGVSRWSIYAWLSQGRIRKTKVGSRVMIGEGDLQAFISSCNPDLPAERNAPAVSAAGAAMRRDSAQAEERQ